MKCSWCGGSGLSLEPGYDCPECHGSRVTLTTHILMHKVERRIEQFVEADPMECMMGLGDEWQRRVGETLSSVSEMNTSEAIHRMAWGALVDFDWQGLELTPVLRIEAD